MKDGDNFIENTKKWTSIRNGCFLGVFILAYLLGVTQFISQLKHKIWQTKGLLNLIPIKFLLGSKDLKNMLLTK